MKLVLRRIKLLVKFEQLILGEIKSRFPKSLNELKKKRGGYDVRIFKNVYPAKERTDVHKEELLIHFNRMNDKKFSDLLLSTNTKHEERKDSEECLV